MTEDLTKEFPFVEELPKRAKSKMRSLWDTFTEFRAIAKEKGMLVPQNFAAQLGGVSKQRIDQLCNAGILERVRFSDRPFVTEDSLVAWMKSERANGRPLGSSKFSGCVEAAKELASRPSKKS